MQLLRHLYEVLLERPLLIWVISSTIAFYKLMFLALANWEEFRVQLAKIVSGEEGLFKRYTHLLNYLVQLTKKLFFKTGEARTERKSLTDVYGLFVTISLTYTTLFFFLGWITSGDASIGIIRVIAPEYPLSGRLLILAALLAFSYLIWTVLPDPFALEKRIDGGLSAIGLPFGQRISFAVIGTIFIYISEVIGFDRFFGMPRYLVGLLEIILASVGFCIIYWSPRGNIVAFSYVLTCSVMLMIGIPFAVLAPLAVAMVSVVAGYRPVFFSIMFVPLLMGIFYSLPEQFTRSVASNFVLAAITFFPLIFATYAVSRMETTRLRSALYAAVCLPPLATAVALSSQQVNESLAFAIVIFWLVMPIINATFDSLSWSFTWVLLDNLAKRLSSPESTTKRRFTSEIVAEAVRGLRNFSNLAVHIILNIAFSGLFLVLTFYFIVGALEASNLIATLVRPEYAFDSMAIVNDLIANPTQGRGLWLASMLISTFVPTILHFLVIVFAILAMAFEPRMVREAWQLLTNRSLELKAGNSSIRIVTSYASLSVLIGLLVLVLIGDGASALGLSEKFSDGLSFLADLAIRNTRWLWTAARLG